MPAKTLLATILTCLFCAAPPCLAGDLTEQMKQSLVYLEVSAYAYDRMQPWKPADIVHKTGYASAVGPSIIA